MRLRRARRNAATRRARAERGASAVELAILAPILLVVTLLIIQFALWFQAREAALAAAQEGATVIREQTAANRTTACSNAVTATNKYYHDLGTSILQSPTPTCVYGTADGVLTSGVSITGHAISLLGPFQLPITVTVKGPDECFHPLAAGGGC